MEPPSSATDVTPPDSAALSRPLLPDYFSARLPAEAPAENRVDADERR